MLILVCCTTVMDNLVGACKSKQGKDFTAVMKSRADQCTTDYGNNVAANWAC